MSSPPRSFATIIQDPGPAYNRERTPAFLNTNAMVVGLLIVTYIPMISMWLPTLLGMA
jgi:hypothetical protein